MKKNWFSLSKSLEAKACCGAFSWHFSKFYDYKYDFLIAGYINILENRDKYINIIDNDLRLNKLYQLANDGMIKYLNSLNKMVDCYSVDDSIRKDEKDDFSNFDFVDLKTYDTLEYKQVLQLYKNCLLDFPKLHRCIINRFVYYGDKISDIVNDYKIKTSFVKKVLYDFRVKFYLLLLDNGYVLPFKIEDISMHRKKFVKSQDLLIIRLIIQNQISVDKIADLLDLSSERVSNILAHKRNNQKFYLYQIEKLRQHFFQNYSLESLANV